jgi:glycosyltransferase involved in cell wall biosynthesis
MVDRIHVRRDIDLGRLGVPSKDRSIDRKDLATGFSMDRVVPAHSGSTATVGLLPWGYLIEDFLDTIGISLDEFCSNFTGSWMFGYVDALRAVGVSAVIICISGRVSAPTWRRHTPTGAMICILPAPPVYRLVTRVVRNPYARSVKSMFRIDLGGRLFLWPILAVLREMVGYLTTPPISLARALMTSRCDAVLCQEYEFPRFDICVLIGRLLGLPVFATFQGGDYQRSRVERLIRPLAMRGCKGLVIGAGREIRRVRERYRISDSKLAQIFNPVDLAVWHPSDREAARIRLGLPREARVVAWHGRVSKWKKGLDHLVNAWARVCDEHPDVDLRLVLVGDGEDATWLQRQINALGLRGIHWHRAFLQDRTAIRTYLSAADVYAFSSRHEGFAVALIEAMACGLPVVSTDISGTSDIFMGGEASGGVVVAPEDSVALAAALWRLLSDLDLSRELGRRARERAKMAFATATVGRQLHAFLLQDAVHRK